MKKPPEGWPQITSCLFYDDAGKAIDWLSRAFGFEVRARVEGEGGRILHSELTLGQGVILVGQSGGNPGRPKPLPGKSPRALGGANTQALFVYVDDVDAHARAARAAGAQILEEPKDTDFGAEWWMDRTYRAVDLEGHEWYFAQRLRNPPSQQ